jgi:hypothetical protein
MASTRAPLYPFSENSEIAVCKMRSRVVAGVLGAFLFAETPVGFADRFGTAFADDKAPDDEAVIALANVSMTPSRRVTTV